MGDVVGEGVGRGGWRSTERTSQNGVPGFRRIIETNRRYPRCAAPCYPRVNGFTFSQRPDRLSSSPSRRGKGGKFGVLVQRRSSFARSLLRWESWSLRDTDAPAADRTERIGSRSGWIPFPEGSSVIFVKGTRGRSDIQTSQAPIRLQIAGGARLLPDQPRVLRIVWVLFLWLPSTVEIQSLFLSSSDQKSNKKKG